MTLTPEQIEKEFDEYIKEKWPSLCLRKMTDGSYVSNDTFWIHKGWLARQESLAVELDMSKIIRDCVLKTELGAYAQSNLSGGFGLIDEVVKCAMQSAGINYREKE